jgi:Alpha/beta hydrolase family
MYFWLAPAEIRVLAPGRSQAARRGHEVLSPDLPADDDSAELGEYTEAVVSVLGDRADLIVVAQSLAAFLAPMLCERVDARLILVAPMIASPREAPGAWWTNTGQTTARRRQDEPEGRGSRRGIRPHDDLHA